jgi:ubiquinone/menaquinone biosynthesis C-methylase UbiE
METPNAEAIQVWNDIVGPKYLRHGEVITSGFSRHSDAAIARHPIAPGARVLEIGCGLGDLSLELARAVGPGGAVVGVDCAARFLEHARAQPGVDGLPQLGFLEVDAQVHPFEPTWDRVVSRFGTMFFQSPVHALRNLRGALRPGGELLMLVWRRLDANAWLSLAKEVALRLLPPPPDGPTCGPGPFSMADPETVTLQLRAAGYERIAFEPVDVPVRLGSIADAVQFMLDLGPAGELVRLAGDLGVERRPALAAALADELAPFVTQGAVEIDSASWCVTARNPSV